MNGGVPLAADAERALAAVAGDGAVTEAEIWATVDLERTLAELGIEGLAASAAAAARPDPLLGARALIVPAGPDGPRRAFAEPTTEGRLAATLARHGEGPAGRYLAVGDDLDAARTRATAAGIPVSRIEAGPFGPSMLVLIGPVSGPHLILCDPAAVPSAP
ncbi:MAG TPA: hypothetical protein VE640_10020 [Candidatus Bathyarchaeia archaeon]|jgi:hypothetical protein|nr:hypothetical protein [Candidatus Bathyarchaeia archaeon]